jgi:hypothetical protein
MPVGIPRVDEESSSEANGGRMSYPGDDREARQARPIWAAPPVAETPVEPVAPPEARAWLALAERRVGLPARVLARSAGLLVLGALMVSGVTLAAFASDGSSGTAAAPKASAATLTAEGSTAVAGDPVLAEDELPADTTPTGPGADPGAGGTPPPDTGTTDPGAGSDPTSTGTDPGAGSDPGAGGDPGAGADPGAGSGDTGASSTGTTSPPTGAGASTGTKGTKGTKGGKKSGKRSGKAHRRPRPTAAPTRKPVAAPLPTLTLAQALASGPAPRPLPALKELTRRQAYHVHVVSYETKVGWPILAAIRRIGLHRGQHLHAAAAWLRIHGAHAAPGRPFSSRRALKRYYHSWRKADRATALAAYYWAIGGKAMQTNLREASPTLATTVLDDPNLDIYPGGRDDIAGGRIDPRVLMTIRYLEAAFGTVRVSCLISGHSVMTASGNVSQHIFGRAVDVAAVGGIPIYGNQGRGTVTERAVRLLLMLPKDLAARQIVSLMDLDGPTGNTGSFALPDHYDHIHVGF